MNESNKIVVPGCGWARFYRQPIAKSRWKDPARPEYQPNWIVVFRVLRKSWKQTAVDGDVCFPVAGGLRDVSAWAKERIRTEAHLLQAGKVSELRAMREAPSCVSLARLGEVYLANVPPVGRENYVKNLGRLRRIGQEMTGLPDEEIKMTDATWNRERLQGWVRMRQEHARRGWTVPGAEPAGAWDVLRADLKAGRLPGVDKRTVMECNTTIRGYLRCAKAVFANGREYLPGLVLPDLAEFLAFSPDLAAPEGHREIPAEAWARIWQAAPTLRESDPAAWSLLQVLAWTGCRPVQALALQREHLKAAGEGYLLTVPAAKRGADVVWPLDADLGAALLANACDFSLVGATSKTAGAKAHNRLNEWLREQGLTGTHGAYLLRHARGQQLRQAGGLELAASGLGHKGTAMAARKYTAGQKVMPLLPLPAAG